MTRNSDIAVRTISALVLSLFIIAGTYFAYRFLRCFYDAKKVGVLDSYDCIHFVVYGSSQDTVSGRFTLLDRSGREIAEIERSWSGQYLYLEFSSARFNDAEYVFPTKLYSNWGSNRSGTSLFHYYMENGECLVLSYPYTKAQRKAMYHLGVFAKAKADSFFTHFSRQLSLDLSQCKSGCEYAVTVTPQ